MSWVAYYFRRSKNVRDSIFKKLGSVVRGLRWVPHCPRRASLIPNRSRPVSSYETGYVPERKLHN